MRYARALGQLRRRSAIEAVIGHVKTDGHLGRCHLKGRGGDAANAILTAVGHNLRLILAVLVNVHQSQPAFKSAS
jgi:transposase, IS5 family